MRHNGKSFPPLPLLTLGSNTFCRVSKHPSLLRLSSLAFSLRSTSQETPQPWVNRDGWSP